jgi:hypothetical protein
MLALRDPAFLRRPVSCRGVDDERLTRITRRVLQII